MFTWYFSWNILMFSEGKYDDKIIQIIWKEFEHTVYSLENESTVCLF